VSEIAKEQPAPSAVHVDTLAAGADHRKRRKPEEDEMTQEELFKAESAIYKRDFTGEQRKALAAKGWALADGSYPIETQADLHPAAVLARSGHGDATAARALISRRAKELGAPDPLAKSDAVQIDVKLFKAQRQGKVYGVVLEPNLPDSQGDTVTPEEIEKACHRFMVQSQKADVQHSEEAAGAQLIENFIAPQDLRLAGEHVTEGSWVQAWQITDPVVKREIEEGMRTGFSIGGSGVRVHD
jgi:hypothetical protein